MKSIDFELVEPMEFDDSTGNTRETCLLSLRAPSVKNRKYAAKLKQTCLLSMGSMRKQFADVSDADLRKMAEEEEKKEKKDESVSSMINFVMMSDAVDSEEFVDTFVKLICSPGVCMIDNDTPMKEFFMESMSYEDLERMMGVYLQTFLPMSPKPIKSGKKSKKQSTS